MTQPLPLETAQARLLAMAAPLPLERVEVAGALGRYLAEPLHARRTQPAAAIWPVRGGSSAKAPPVIRLAAALALAKRCVSPPARPCPQARAR